VVACIQAHDQTASRFRSTPARIRLRDASLVSTFGDSFPSGELLFGAQPEESL